MVLIFVLGIVVMVAMEISELITHVYLPGDHSSPVCLCSSTLGGVRISEHSLFWLWNSGPLTWNLLLWMMASSPPSDPRTWGLSYNCFKTSTTKFCKPTLKSIQWSLFYWYFVNHRRLETTFFFSLSFWILYHSEFWMALTHEAFLYLSTFQAESIKYIL